MFTEQAPASSACRDSHHFVRFYEDEVLLAEEIVSHLHTALAQGGSGILIATAARVGDVTARLRAALGTQASGALARLVVLDAAETLAQLSVGGWPDRGRFDAVMGTLVRTARNDGAPLHAYGEMVALLCADGRYEAAVRLEQLWNELAGQTAFSLFCAYPWTLFPTAELAESFAAICKCHSHAGSQRQPGAGTVGRNDAMVLLELERKAFALDGEVARRQAAERLAAATQADLAEFLDNAAEGIHRVGPDGTILWANKAELALLGYRWDEYVGHHIAEFHVDSPVIEHILDTLLGGGTLYDQPARLRCRDGSVRHVVIHSNGCFENGQLRYTRCFTRDATERHERDRALLQRDQMILRSPVATALLIGPELRFQVVNERFVEMAGGAELRDRTFAQAFPAAVGGRLHALLQQVHASGTAFSADEICLQEFHGASERYIRLSLEPLQNEQGATEGVLAVVVDITEHVTARKSLEQARDEREVILTALTEANRNKDQFLAMLGHELRNPLSPILMALEMMELRGDASFGQERRVMRRQLDHLVRLVDDLLDIARVTQGKIELKSESMALDAALHKAVEIASADIRSRAHALTLSVEPALMVNGDPVRLAQVVANLLINAARYTANGGAIRLTAARDAAGSARISILDNGRGMSGQELRQVFDLFYQGPRGIDRAEGGLGVGLSLAHRLVELHGGHIEAHSAGPGLGSEFIVVLPVLPAAAVPVMDARVSPTEAIDAVRSRILIVDDNADAARMLGVMLEQHGHIVELCHDPITALDKLAAFRPDLAILDIGLPLMSGHELAQRIRNKPGGESCRLIALSGFGQPEDALRSKDAGFEQHLVKPVQPQALLSLLGRRSSAAS
ncbi:PAS domain-containing protein [Pseudoduganella plicata]|nr:PAS domain-containing protein [Pseudoduganella plicata]QBQ36169.1 response regulator [Pseudoduganella plicata]